MAFLGNVEYRPDEAGTAEEVKCPLADEWIAPVRCMLNQEIKEEYIPARFKARPDWKEICISCPFRDY